MDPPLPIQNAMDPPIQNAMDPLSRFKTPWIPLSQFKTPWISLSRFKTLIWHS